ncbi:MAG: lipopolysaccharide biosynthesis protein [Terriglobales bacterium]
MSAAVTSRWDEVPTELRRPLLGGLRWTLWLAVAGVPFSYATRVLLARVGPECLAVFGLLLVYIGYVAAFLFLGGNAVAIRYVPALDARQRRDFLASYVAVLAAGWLPWVGLAALAPHTLRWLFGNLGGAHFALIMVLLAPLPILFSLLLAALKGALELTAAQAIYRGVTLGMFAGVAALVLAAPHWLAGHAAGLLWGWYLFLMAAGIGAAAWRWRRQAAAGRPRWYLPRGFWGYLGGLQVSSMLGFFATQLDVLLVWHAGGLRRLGDYVALIALSATAIAAIKLLLDAHMTALTQGSARQDAALTGALFRNCSRLLFPMILLLGAGLACWARPLLAIYGAAYAGLLPALRWLGPCAALAAMNFLLGSSLAALGHPRAEIRAKCVRIAAFLALFFPLWHARGVEGAVLAWGGAELPYQAVNLWYLRRHAPFRLGWRRLYSAFLACVALTAIAVQGLQPGLAEGTAIWVAVAVAFFTLGGYSRAEIREQIHLFLPGAAALAGRA